MEYNMNEEFSAQEKGMERDTQIDDYEMMPYDMQHGYGHGIMPQETQQMYGQPQNPQTTFRQGNILPLLLLGLGSYGFNDGFYPYDSPYYSPYYPPYYSPYYPPY